MSSRFTFPVNSTNPLSMLPQEDRVFENKMKFFEQMANSQPNNAIHKKAYISPPTWTIDRITSLITGGYPSQDLVDLMTGFSGQDHLLEDIGHSKNVFFGDVIWRPILDKNSRVHFDKKKYYNFFIMSRGEISDTQLINDAVEVVTMMI